EQVVPAGGFESGAVLAQLEEDLLHLEHRGDGLDMRGGPDGALLDAEAVLGVDEDLVPQPGLLRGLELRQVEVRAGAVTDEVAGVVEEVQAEVDQGAGGRELLAAVVDVEQVLLRQVPAAGTQPDGRL